MDWHRFKLDARLVVWLLGYIFWVSVLIGVLMGATFLSLLVLFS